MGKTVLSSNRTLLWTNSSLNTNFGATTVSLSGLSDYNEVEIVWTYATSNPTFIGGNCRIPIGFSRVLSQVGGTSSYSSGNICVVNRLCTVSTTGITFGRANLGYDGAVISAGYDHNIIPYKIYGIK